MRGDVAQLQFCALPDDGELWITMYGREYPEDELIKVRKSKLDYNFEKSPDGFIFVWGWPGPDYNRYRFEDHGKTWAFTKKEMTHNGD